jgi:transposase
MTKPLGEDLRVRVVGAVREGLSRHASAALFGVKHLERDPVGQAGGRDRFLLDLVRAEPDLTLTEILGRLVRRRIIVGHARVWRFFAREKISFK